MNCPNCYTQGLAATLLRCPRCDWLLVGPQPAAASSAFPQPPLTNPWSDGAAPGLPVAPASPGVQQQIEHLWRQERGESYQPIDLSQGAIQQTVPLEGKQRLPLFFLAYASLMPLVLMPLLFIFVTPVAEIISGMSWPAFLFLLPAALMLYIARIGVLALIDGLEGVGLQTVDRLTEYRSQRYKSRRHDVIVLERTGKMPLLGQHTSPAVGALYRVSYTPRTKLAFALEPLAAPTGASDAAPWGRQ